MKDYICAAIGAAGGALASAFGGWDAGLATLVAFMIIDFSSGFVVAGVFHQSRKTESGALESRIGWKGLCKKAMTLVFVLVAHRLDIVLSTSYVRDTVCIGFMANELLSIVENAGLMGIPLPSVITKSIDILTKKGEENE